MIDVYNFNHINKKNFKKYVHIDGLENLNDLKNEPVILYTFHYSRFILPLIVLSKIHRTMGCVINDSSGVPFIEELFRKYKLNLMEKSMKGNFFYTNKSMFRIFKYLKNSNMLVYLIDLNADINSRRSINVKFMDRMMCLYDTIIRLSVKSGAKLVPYVAFEDNNKIYPIKCKILKPVVLDESSTTEQKMYQILSPLEIMKTNKDQWWLNN